MKYFVLAFLSFGSLCFSGCGVDSAEISCPDGQINFRISVVDSQPSYSVLFNDQVVIENSMLGFLTSDSLYCGDNVRMKDIEKTSIRSSWEPVYGEANLYENNYEEMLVHFESTTTDQVYFNLRIRAYDEGVAFRYEFNEHENVEILDELTEFSISGDPTVWVSKRAQSAILKKQLSELSGVFERPVLSEIDDSVFIALGEAELVDFARMKLASNNSSESAFKASLTRSPENPILIPAGKYSTPWRYIMIGKSPSELLQNNHFVLNLNRENQLTDHSWIKPGKIIREVTLTTQGAYACVDFAAKHNLQYVEFDAGWYGNEYDNASDASTITVDPKRSPGPLELLNIITYAKQKEIGIILYVNKRALEKQLDEILPIYQSWGVAGLKYGFVQVGSQKWTSWLHEAVKKAADYKLMVDIHDEYRPTGFSRTYPNLMTQEGIRGDEESPTNDMVINTIYTRMIAGAGDQTNCYFASRVDEKMGSHASQMAKAICIYSPWQFLYWYDRPFGSPGKKGGAGGAEGFIPEIPDLEFYDQLPTSWDASKIIDGYPGEFVIIARKKDDVWYVGALTGTIDKEIIISLDFLDEDTNYKAKIYSDDASLDSETRIRIQSMNTNHAKMLSGLVNQQNGMAIILTPTNDQ